MHHLLVVRGLWLGTRDQRPFLRAFNPFYNKHTDFGCRYSLFRQNFSGRVQSWLWASNWVSTWDIYLMVVRFRRTGCFGWIQWLLLARV